MTKTVLNHGNTELKGTLVSMVLDCLMPLPSQCISSPRNVPHPTLFFVSHPPKKSGDSSPPGHGTLLRFLQTDCLGVSEGTFPGQQCAVNRHHLQSPCPSLGKWLCLRPIQNFQLYVCFRGLVGVDTCLEQRGGKISHQCLVAHLPIQNDKAGFVSAESCP